MGGHGHKHGKDWPRDALSRALSSLCRYGGKRGHAAWPKVQWDEQSFVDVVEITRELGTTSEAVLVVARSSGNDGKYRFRIKHGPNEVVKIRAFPKGGAMEPLGRDAGE